MADIVTLAQFDFDSDRLEKGIEALQKQLFELTKRQQELNTQSKEVNKSLESQTKESERLVQNFKNGSREYQKAVQEQAKLSKSGQENTQVYRELNAEKQRLISTFKQEDSQYQAVNQEVQELSNKQEGLFLSTKDLQIQRDVLNKEYRTATTLYKQFIGVNGEVLSIQEVVNESVRQEVTTREQAKAVNQQLNKIKDQLNVTNEDERKLLDEINERIDANNKLLVESGSQNEQRTANIGKYTESIQEAAGNLNIFNGGLQGFVQRSQEAGGAGNLVGGSLKGMATGFAGVTKASLAFIATPIGAVIAALGAVLGLVINYFKNTQEGMDALTSVTRPLIAAFEVLMGVLQEVGKFIVDVFREPKKYMEDLYNFMKNQIIRQFESFSKILEGIFTMDFSLIKEGFKDLSDQAAENIGRITGAVGELNNRFKESIEIGKELDALTKEYELTQIRNAELLPRLNAELREANKIAEDATKTGKQREDAAIRTLDISKQINAAKRQELVLELKIAENRASRNDTSRADELAMAEIKGKLYDADAAAAEQQTTQQNKLNSIRKSGNDEYAKAIDKQITKQKELLELFVAEQGIREKTLFEQYKIQEEVSKKSLAILDRELKNKKISQEKYDLEVLKLTQDRARLQAEISVQLAEKNLDAFIYENQERLKNGQLLTDALLAQEIERNRSIADERDKFAKTQFENGLINNDELNRTLLENQRAYLAEEKTLKERNAQDNRTIEATRRAEEFETNLLQLQENLASEFEIRKAQADFEFEDQKLQLEQQRADGLITEQNYQLALNNIIAANAQVRKQIEDEVQNAKLNIYKDVFSGIAELVGEQTAMGKAAGIATATINTYQGVSEVWKSPSVLPEPFNTILKAVQTGITVASGLKTVKQITAVKTPSVKGYATGGKISGGFGIKRSNGDDVLITAKRGEAILNEKQQSYIGTNLLSLAGVPGFATGGLVGNSAASSAVQNNLLSNFNMAAISDAVRQGAMEGTQQGSFEGSYQGSQVGSQQGISQLSSDRGMQRSSNF